MSTENLPIRWYLSYILGFPTHTYIAQQQANCFVKQTPDWFFFTFKNLNGQTAKSVYGNIVVPTYMNFVLI